MGAPLGNKNASNSGRTQWRDAIRKALAKDKKALERVATRLIKAAKDGDMQAIKELGDRLDGKPTQTVNGTLTHAIAATDLSDAELAAIAAGSSPGTSTETDSQKELH